MPQPLSESNQAAVDAALHAGQKIDAIKIYREATGASLLDSKNAVEAREIVLRGTAPQNFAVQEGGGCVSVVGVVLVLVGLILVAVIAFFFWGMQ